MKKSAVSTGELALPANAEVAVALCSVRSVLRNSQYVSNAWVSSHLKASQAKHHQGSAPAVCNPGSHRPLWAWGGFEQQPDSCKVLSASVGASESEARAASRTRISAASAIREASAGSIHTQTHGRSRQGQGTAPAPVSIRREQGVSCAASKLAVCVSQQGSRQRSAGGSDLKAPLLRECDCIQRCVGAECSVPEAPDFSPRGRYMVLRGVRMSRTRRAGRVLRVLGDPRTEGAQQPRARLPRTCDCSAGAVFITGTSLLASGVGRREKSSRRRGWRVTQNERHGIEAPSETV
ncbi:hypothetical protein FQR65_LT20069 [Abscondita terminalis]|nr:hypothetical protein FQR65_LT20069 [Abscondita terminalis]